MEVGPDELPAAPVLGSKDVSKLPEVFKRAMQFLLVPSYPVKAPAMIIFPSGCSATDVI